MIEPFDQLKTVNSAIANGQKVGFFLDHSLVQADKLKEQAAQIQVTLQDFADCIKNGQWRHSDAVVLLTDKLVTIDVPHVFLRPPTLVVGVGCRRGTACETIVAAIQAACRMIGRSSLSITQLTSVGLKQDELGLLAAGEQLGAELKFFDGQQMQQCILKYKLASSNFVQEQIGVGNVCEAAALLAAQNDQLVLHKTKFPQVTVAIAEANLIL
jgi:cobalt-precorrin 5A hydrolase